MISFLFPSFFTFFTVNIDKVMPMILSCSSILIWAINFRSFNEHHLNSNKKFFSKWNKIRKTFQHHDLFDHFQKQPNNTHVNDLMDQIECFFDVNICDEYDKNVCNHFCQSWIFHYQIFLMEQWWSVSLICRNIDEQI